LRARFIGFDLICLLIPVRTMSVSCELFWNYSARNSLRHCVRCHTVSLCKQTEKACIVKAISRRLDTIT